MEYTISVSDEGTTILTGQPETVELAERTIREFKTFFNHPGLRNPEIRFSLPDGTEYTVRPRLVSNGWQAKPKRKEWTLGINLFRVKNRSGRYALTVWIEPLTVAV